MADHPLATAAVLDRMIGLLDRVEPDRGTLAPADRLALVTAARRVSGRVEALLCTLVAEAEAGDAAMRAKATPLSSWLAVSGTVSKREAAGLLHRSREIATHDRVRQAALAGEVQVNQARAIAGVLSQLPTDLDDGQRDQAEQLLVDLAGRLDATELSKSTGQVLAAVSPQSANEAEETRLQRAAELAHRQRGLRFFRNGASVRFDGSLPQADAEAWMAMLDAHAESQRRAILEERDPLAPPLTPEQRRADALIAMVAAHQVGKQAPAAGGDRPRVLVYLHYDRLQAEAAAAGLIADGAELSAGELRRLCCDAGVLPVVLGGDSEPLDVGREYRLVTPAIRAALTARDRGCAFPTCATRPAVCEAHHIVPWWQNGITALSNLVLLCHHHHALVEPAKNALRDQWQVRIAADGLPEFIPPRRLDPAQQPMRHRRLVAARMDGVEPDEVPVGDIHIKPDGRLGERAAIPACSRAARPAATTRIPATTAQAASDADATPAGVGIPDTAKPPGVDHAAHSRRGARLPDRRPPQGQRHLPAGNGKRRPARSSGPAGAHWITTRPPRGLKPENHPSERSPPGRPASRLPANRRLGP